METMTKAHGPMQIFEQLPAPALRPFLKRFLLVEFPAQHRDIHLPDIGPVAAFSLRGTCLLDDGKPAPQAAFTGLWETARSHKHVNHAVLLATFTPVGAAAFLRPSLEEFVGTTTDLADILSRPEELGLLQEQLAESHNHGQCVQLLEAFFMSRLCTAAPDPLVTAAVTWLEKQGETSRMTKLTEYIGLSQSALERRFRRIIGVSPKKFASLMRLGKAVRLRASGADFTTVAQGAGYFDQSHFIKDFHRATGTTPDAFFRQRATE